MNYLESLNYGGTSTDFFVKLWKKIIIRKKVHQKCCIICLKKQNSASEFIETEIETEGTIIAETGNWALRLNGEASNRMILTVDRNGVVFDRRWDDKLLVIRLDRGYTELHGGVGVSVKWNAWTHFFR